jgi:hypothetical protein
VEPADATLIAASERFWSRIPAEPAPSRGEEYEESGVRWTVVEPQERGTPVRDPETKMRWWASDPLVVYLAIRRPAPAHRRPSCETRRGRERRPGGRRRRTRRAASRAGPSSDDGPGEPEPRDGRVDGLRRPEAP